MGLGPWLGALIPLNDAFFGGSAHESPGMAIDIAFEYAVVGVERGGVFAGFGIWDAL